MQTEAAALSFTPGERDVFRRREHVPPSRWAERHVVITSGPYEGMTMDASVNSYLAEIMDTWADPHVEQVVVCGSPQTGKTTAMYACLKYSAQRRHGPKMLTMPDDEALDRVTEGKLRPGFTASRTLRALVKSWTLDKALFRDGSWLYFSSAQSQSQRASVEVRDLFMDEQDLYKRQEKKGDPITDFIERTISYTGKRKLFHCSKPVGDESSSIVAAFRACQEQRYRHAKCPACNELQRMEADRIVDCGCTDPKEMRQEKRARYECAHCGYLWTDQARNRAVESGRWIAENPVERPRSVGFHVPALISQFVSLSDIAADRMEASTENTPTLWQAYYNGRLAEPYAPVAIATAAEKILDLVIPTHKPRTVPSRAVALTCGIDTQKRGFWYVVRAWALNLESWLVDYGFLPNWEAVRQLVHESGYPVEETGEVRQIWRAAIDSGGTIEEGEMFSRTEEVYQFVRAHGQGVLFATKGASGPQLRRVKTSVIDKLPRSNVPIPGGLELFMLDPNAFKELVHARLAPDSVQPIHLHAETARDYADQVSAEEMHIEKGKRIWKKIRRDNHLLDAECLAAACADPQWAPGLQLVAGLTASREHEAHRQLAAASPSASPVPPAARNRPSWWSRR